MPTYFIDRFAFASMRRPRGIDTRSVASFASTEVHDRDAFLRQCVVPCSALGGWIPDPATPTEVGAFYSHLRELWRGFAGAMKLPERIHVLTDARDSTWRNVFDESVFVPRGPAIPGAIFFDAIAEGDRRHVVATFGREAVADFYCFMLQVHESLHFVQVGEPLFNEMVQASTWITFLDKYPDLWRFQRNSETKRSCVREEPLVRRHPHLAEVALQRGLDTASTVDELAGEGAYFVCCAWANRFDSGRLRYAEYVRAISDVLDLSTSSPDWRIEARRALRS